MGPIPYRRTGGHTGPHGVAYLVATELPAADYGLRSTFDIVPTIVQLLGESSARPLSGEGALTTIAARG
jgi:hypothetical protein